MLVRFLKLKQAIIIYYEEAANDTDNHVKTHTSYIRSQSGVGPGAVRTHSLSPTSENRPAPVIRGQSVPRVKSPLSSGSPPSEHLTQGRVVGTSEIKTKVPLPYRSWQTKPFMETTVSKPQLNKQPASKVNKNVKKVAKPVTKKSVGSLLSPKGPVPSTSSGKGLGGVATSKSKPKAASRSPEFPSQRNIQSQYELVFGAESERKSRASQKASVVSSARGSSQISGKCFDHF